MTAVIRQRSMRPMTTKGVSLPRMSCRSATWYLAPIAAMGTPSPRAYPRSS